MSGDGDCQTTTQDITFWVDSANGSDWNSGVQESPLKTLVAAIRKIPLVVRHNVTVNVRSGTYKEKLDLLFLFAGGGDIKFVGMDWNKFSPAAPGIQSGTFDIDFGTPAIPNTASCAGGGWAADDLKGKFVRITSGTDNGKYFPIANNTATSIDFGMPVDRIAGRGKDFRGQTFQIVEHAVVLEQQITTSESPYLISVCGTSPPSQSRFIGPLVSQNGIHFQNFQFNMGSAFEALVCNSGGVLRLQSCKLNYSPNTASYGFFGRGSPGTFVAADCYWAMLSSGHYGFGTEGLAAIIRLFNCIMDNGHQVGVVTSQGSYVGISGLYQNQQYGIGIRNSIAQCASNIVLRGLQVGFFVVERSSLILRPIAGCGFLMNIPGSGITVTGFNNSIELKNL